MPWPALTSLPALRPPPASLLRYQPGRDDSRGERRILQTRLLSDDLSPVPSLSGRPKGGEYLAGDDAVPHVIAVPDGEMLAGLKGRLCPVAGQRDGHHGMRAGL